MHTTGENFFFLNLILIFLACCVFGAVNAQSPLPEAEAALVRLVAGKHYREAAVQAHNIAGVYRNAKKADRALEFFNQSLTYARKANDISAQYRATMSIGEVYGDIKKYSSAQDQFEAAIKLARQQKNKTQEGESLVALAQSHAANARPKRAIGPAEQALVLAIEQNDQALRQKCYKLLAEYHRLTGNSVKANEYLLQHNVIQEKEDADRKFSELARQNKKTQDLTERQLRELQDHISQVESEKTATLSALEEQRSRLQQTEDSLRMKGDSLRMIEAISQQRQLQIDLLNKDKELADVRIKEQKARIENEVIVRRSVVAGILMVAVLATVLIINYRRKLKVNKELHRQNENIKSSINYAKRIQEAMLPRTDQHWLLSDSFLLFKPRDVVSGDFYWFSELPNGHADRSQHDFAFAAIDCTGHGVPGAFMSMIGINALNGFISRGVTETNTLLDALHTEIRNALRQELTGNNDGMDAALCIYRRQRNVLEFSGAKNPLVYIQDNTLHRIKGDIHSIGGSKSKSDLSFRKHTITIDRPATVYLFSDGYRDQFGGRENSKFMGKRFHDLLLEIHKLPLAEQREVLDKTIETWKGARTQTDDILVMGIRLG